MERNSAYGSIILGASKGLYTGDLKELALGLQTFGIDVRCYSGSCVDAPVDRNDGFVFSVLTNIGIFTQIASSDSKLWYRFRHPTLAPKPVWREIQIG